MRVSKFKWMPFGDLVATDAESGLTRTLYECPECFALTLEPNDHEDWRKGNDR